MKSVACGRYTIKQKLGAGSFGEIHRGEDKETGQSVAIKLEPVKTRAPQLSYESKLYNIFKNGCNIPRFYWFGTESVHNAMVIELLGKSLEDLSGQLPHHRLSLKTVLMLVDQMISSVQYIHSMNFIHRDIKPDNFMMGTGKNANKIFVIDFGLSKKYRDPHTHQHIKYVENKDLTGTARYASLLALKGVEQSRRDDLEALGFVWLYLLRGDLPWMGLDAHNRRQKYDRICQVKEQTTFESLCAGFPEEFVRYFYAVRQLGFVEEPDYAHFRKMFRKLFIKLGYIYDYSFDWSRPTQNESLRSPKGKSTDYLSDRAKRLPPKLPTNTTKHPKSKKAENEATSKGMKFSTAPQPSKITNDEDIVFKGPSKRNSSKKEYDDDVMFKGPPKRSSNTRLNQSEADVFRMKVPKPKNDLSNSSDDDQVPISKRIFNNKHQITDRNGRNNRSDAPEMMRMRIPPKKLRNNQSDDDDDDGELRPKQKPMSGLTNSQKMINRSRWKSDAAQYNMIKVSRPKDDDYSDDIDTINKRHSQRTRNNNNSGNNNCTRTSTNANVTSSANVNVISGININSGHISKSNKQKSESSEEKTPQSNDVNGGNSNKRHKKMHGRSEDDDTLPSKSDDNRIDNRRSPHAKSPGRQRNDSSDQNNSSAIRAKIPKPKHSDSPQERLKKSDSSNDSMQHRSRNHSNRQSPRKTEKNNDNNSNNSNNNNNNNDSTAFRSNDQNDNEVNIYTEDSAQISKSKRNKNNQNSNSSNSNNSNNNKSYNNNNNNNSNNNNNYSNIRNGNVDNGIENNIDNKNNDNTTTPTNRKSGKTNQQQQKNVDSYYMRRSNSKPNELSATFSDSSRDDQLNHSPMPAPLPAYDSDSESDSFNFERKEPSKTPQRPPIRSSRLHGDHNPNSNTNSNTNANNSSNNNNVGNNKHRHTTRISETPERTNNLRMPRHQTDVVRSNRIPVAELSDSYDSYDAMIVEPRKRSSKYNSNTNNTNNINSNAQQLQQQQHTRSDKKCETDTGALRTRAQQQSTNNNSSNINFNSSGRAARDNSNNNEIDEDISENFVSSRARKSEAIPQRSSTNNNNRPIPRPGAAAKRKMLNSQQRHSLRPSAIIPSWMNEKFKGRK